MNKKILVVVSEWGYWGEELVGPLEVLDAQGYESTVMTAKGRRPHALPPSKQAGYFDPPLKKVVTDEYYARKTRELDASPRLDTPVNLAAWFPERPYFNDPNFGHELEAYYNARDECWKQLEAYDALLMVGGAGPMIDMVNNQRLHDVILGFYHLNKLITAECYAVPCLAFARDWTDRRSIIRGKHVTGHAIEYDYKDLTGVLDPETGELLTRERGNPSTWVNFGPPFYPLEFILRDAVGPDGQYHGGVGRTRSTILDYPFLTGRSTQDSRLVGEKMIEVLEHGLRRWGW
jgi:putative intracellular protease/amidase